MRAGMIAASLLLAACVNAPGSQSRPAPLTAPAAAAEAFAIAIDLPAGEYRLDPRHASVIFRIRHQGLAWFTARFDARDATLHLDPEDPSRSRLEASVEANSVNTGVLNSQGERDFDRQIARALGAETTPRIGFVSSSISRTGRFTGAVTGDLTMNGQTHPAVFDVTYDGGRTDPLRAGAAALGFSARATIPRSAWGATQWSAFTGDEVEIVIEAEFVKT